jgi:hypothetical protein
VNWQPELAIAVTSPAAEEARRILRAYFDDVASRYYGRPATRDEIAAAMSEDPSDDLAPPRGLLLVAREKGDALGCACCPATSLRSPACSWFPRPAAGGLAPGSLTAWKSTRRHRVSALRLDTRRDLIEARRLYARHGYREVAPFGSGAYADHWFEKTLS